MATRTTEGSDRDTGTRRLAGDYQEVRSSVVVAAPVDVVWAVVNDPSAFVEAIDWVFEVWVEDDELREGSVYLERAKPGLRSGTYRWEVTAFDPPKRSVHYHRSDEFEAELHVRCEALDDETTRYTQVLRFRALPAFRPLGYVLERTVMKRNMQGDFDTMILPNFKHIAERRAAAAA